MTRQWTVKVDGNNVKTLHDGESVEIGRKPLRPLSDDGFARLDIMDPGKSMSKDMRSSPSTSRAIAPYEICIPPTARSW